jgi:hypothetical protein
MCDLTCSMCNSLFTAAQFLCPFLPLLFTLQAPVPPTCRFSVDRENPNTVATGVGRGRLTGAEVHN